MQQVWSVDLMLMTEKNGHVGDKNLKKSQLLYTAVIF